jgi:hypothetical protein
VPRSIAAFVRRHLSRRRLAVHMCVGLGLCAPGEEAAPPAGAAAAAGARTVDGESTERCARAHARWQRVRLEDYAEHDRRKSPFESRTTHNVPPGGCVIVGTQAAEAHQTNNDRFASRLAGACATSL